MEPYPSGQFGFIDDPDRQFGNGSVWTRTQTRSDGPEPLLTLLMGVAKSSKIHRLTDTGRGFICQEAVGWIFEHVWDQTKTFLRSQSGLLASYLNCWQITWTCC
jgi:hypothetical protein